MAMFTVCSHSKERKAGAVKATSTDRRCSLIVLFPVVLYLLDVAFDLPPGDGSLYAWVQEHVVELLFLVFAALAVAGPPSLRGLQTRRRHAQPAAPLKPGAAPAVTTGPRAEERSPLARWNQRIDAAAKANDPAQAERLMAKLHAAGLQADTTSYNCVIHACLRKGEQRRAEGWLQQMKANGVPSDTITFNMFMDACAKANDAEGTEAWYKRMVEGGAEANEVSYGIVIHARVKGGDPVGAEQWLRTLIAAGAVPSVVSYNALMHAYSRIGDASSAERLANEILDLGLQASVTTYTTMIDTCAKSGDTERAELWMDKMIQDPHVEPNVVSYSALIEAYAKKNSADSAEKAREWHRRMLEAGVEPNLYSFSAVARPFARVGDWAEVERLKGELLEHGLKVNEYFLNAMLVAYIQGKPRQANKAMAAFKEAVADGVPVTEHVFTALARAVGRLQALEAVRERCGDAVAKRLMSEAQPPVRSRSSF